MPDKTPAQKLFLRPGMTAAVRHAPEGMLSTLGVPEGVALVEDPAGADFVMVFGSTQAEVEKRMRELRPHIGAKTVAWVAFPKGAKAAGRDISRDTIWRFGETIGLGPVSNIAIDETWSALRVKPTA